MKARLNQMLDTIPPAMRPDLRVGGVVLVALIAMTALLLGIYITNIRAERQVLSSDSAFMFSVTVPGSDAATQARTTETAHQTAKDILPDKETPAQAAEVRKSAYDTYKAAPVAAPAGVPQISVILTGFGLSTSQSKAIIDILPPGISLGLSPYMGSDMTAVLETARTKGHEIWLDIPVTDAAALDDPGPYALDPAAPADAFVKQLQIVLGQGQDYAGLLLPASIATRDGVAPLAADRGLAVADLPIQVQPQITAEGLKTYIATSITNGARVVILPLSRLTATALQDMIKTQSLSITPLSTFVKPVTPQADTKTTDNAPPDATLAPAPDEPQQAPPS